MSDNSRVGSCRVGAMVDAGVGAAEAGCFDFDKDIVDLVNVRHLLFNDAELAGFHDTYCFDLFHMSSRVMTSTYNNKIISTLDLGWLCPAIELRPAKLYTSFSAIYITICGEK